jgi:hypothetical protein
MQKFLGVPVFGWSNVGNPNVLLSQKEDLFADAAKKFDSTIEKAQWISNQLLWKIYEIEVLNCGIFDLKIQIDRLSDYSIWITPESKDPLQIKELVNALELKFAVDRSFFIFKGKNLPPIGSPEAFRPFAEAYGIKVNPTSQP